MNFTTTHCEVNYCLARTQVAYPDIITLTSETLTYMHVYTNICELTNNEELALLTETNETKHMLNSREVTLTRLLWNS